MVEVPRPPHTALWHKSSASGDQACVEVARDRERIWVRDSKSPQGAVLEFTHREWDAFLTGVRRGEFG